MNGRAVLAGTPAFDPNGRASRAELRQKTGWLLVAGQRSSAAISSGNSRASSPMVALMMASSDWLIQLTVPPADARGVIGGITLHFTHGGGGCVGGGVLLGEVCPTRGRLPHPTPYGGPCQRLETLNGWKSCWLPLRVPQLAQWKMHQGSKPIGKRGTGNGQNEQSCKNSEILSGASKYEPIDLMNHGFSADFGCKIFHPEFTPGRKSSQISDQGGGHWA